MNSTQEPTHEPGSKAWHALRLTGIGGSDIAAVAGVGKFKSAHDVWLEKVGIATDRETSVAMEVGSALEETVIRMLAEAAEIEARPESLTLRHNDYAFCLVNTDGFVYDDDDRIAGVEAKTSNQFAYAEWQENGVPLNYYCQCQWTMLATGLNKMYVPCIFGGSKFDYWVVERDDADIATLIESARIFWDLVLTKTPPEVDGSPGALAMLNYKYAENNGETCYLDTDADAWVAQYEDAKEAERRAQSLKREAVAHLLDLVGEAKAGVTPDGYRVTSVRTRRFAENIAREHYAEELKPYLTKLDTSALRKGAPGVYEKCKGSASLSLRVTKPKGKK